MPDSNPASEKTTVALCRIEALWEKRTLGFEIPFGETTREILLVADGDHVRGYVDRCPHRGTPLAWTPDRYLDSRGEHLICATHGALFRIDDGHCIAGPCRGEALTPVEVRVEGGEVFVVTSPK